MKSRNTTFCEETKWCSELRIWWHLALERPWNEVPNTQHGYPDIRTNQALKPLRKKKSELLSKCARVSNPRHKGNPIYLDNLAVLFQQTHSFWVTVDNMTERLKPDQILLARPHTQKSQRAAVMNGLDSRRFIVLHLSKPLITQMAPKKNKSQALILVTPRLLSCGDSFVARMDGFQTNGHVCYQFVIMCLRQSTWSEPHTYSW